MRPFLFLAAPLLALSLHATAQTSSKTTTATPSKSAPTAAKPVAAPAAGQQVTEVTEDLDPATGKVIRRTTRTYSAPAAGTSAPAGTTAPASPTTADVPAPTTPASDTVVSDFFRERTVVSRLSTTGLLSAYSRFIEKVRDERRGWLAADWATASSVLGSLNARYDQLRASFTLDDKVTIRSQQAEFQALRTARQVSDQVSNKL